MGAVKTLLHLNDVGFGPFGGLHIFNFCDCRRRSANSSHH